MAAACAAVLLFAVVAAAEPRSDGLAQAREWFAEAETLEADGRWQAAIGRLLRAIAVRETPGLRYHLAYCQAQLGQLVEAMQNYDRALSLIEGGVEAPDVQELLGPARADLERRIPTVQLRIRGAGVGTRVHIDERESSAPDLEMPIRVNPGPHDLVVSAPGFRPIEVKVTMAEGDRHVVQGELRPLPAPPEPRPAADASNARNDGARTIVLVTGASLALASALVGVGYVVSRSAAVQRAEDARDELDQQGATDAGACAPADPRWADVCERLDRANRDGIDASQIATGSFVAAGVLAAATVATFYLWRPSHPSGEVSVGLGTVGGGGLVGSVFGRF